MATKTSGYQEVAAIRIQDQWYRVPSRRQGATFSADQCEGCGACGYKVDGSHAVCIGDDLHGDGCGERYAIEAKPASIVNF